MNQESKLIEFSAVRSIPTKERGNRGFFPSKKVKSGVVEYESQIERDCFLLLEHSPDVKLYQHQFPRVYYRDSEGNSHKYTPDVFVEFIKINTI